MLIKPIQICYTFLDNWELGKSNAWYGRHSQIFYKKGDKVLTNHKNESNSHFGEFSALSGKKYPKRERAGSASSYPDVGQGISELCGAR